MKYKLASALILLCGVLCAIEKSAGFESFGPGPQIGFTANKGQVTDQFGLARPDILFSGRVGAMVFYIRSTGISYQFSKAGGTETDPSKNTDESSTKEMFEVCRVDVDWLNCRGDIQIETIGEKPGYENFYLSGTGGITQVKTYSSIVLKGIYKNVDLRFYENKGELKYDFILGSASDAASIRLQIKGASYLGVDRKGCLVVKTTLGTIEEEKPVTLQSGKTLKSNWKLEGDMASFQIYGARQDEPLVIDPVIRSWGTYYGASGAAYDCTTDSSGNVYFSGETGNSALIATSGAYQTSFGGGTDDAYLVKFNSSGVRQWATFYGGGVSERGNACAVDNKGNVYLAGMTSSSAGIATGGAQQTLFGGFDDAFLAKFNAANGSLIWGTYFGGISGEGASGCTVDKFGDVYICGSTSSNGLATQGAHQQIKLSFTDGYVAKYNTSGVLQWSTYYGGSASQPDYVNDCATDSSGMLYFVGGTFSHDLNVISTPGCHQATFSPSNQTGFLVKMTAQGQRVWGTYYGGIGGIIYDRMNACATDPWGNVYVAGETTGGSWNVLTPTIIATPGTHQPLPSGGPIDAFLVKFDSNGVRHWGTFYGGSQSRGYKCATDPGGNAYLTGFVEHANASPTIIASPGSHQTASAGGHDAFLAKFDSAGVRVWGTFYGTATTDRGNSCAADGQGRSYLCGFTTTYSSSAIASTNGHQVTTPVCCNNEASFFVQFKECTSLPAVGAAVSPSVICSGQAATLIASGATTYSWTGHGTAATFSINPSTSGIYTVTGTTADGCSNTATVNLVVTACTGVALENINDLAFYPYPNPATSQLNILVQCDTRYFVVDPLGRKVMEGEFVAGKNKLGIEGLPRGIYILNLAADQNAYKFVIE